MDQKIALDFIGTISGPLPKIVVAAMQYTGVKEYPGTKNNNPAIMSMARELKVGSIYPNDEVAWCALFICYILYISGKPMPYKLWEILRAKSFMTWGEKLLYPEFGDLIVFERPQGYHVAIYIAETNDTFIVLGGNQSNSVSFTEIKKDRAVAYRRYYEIAPPACVKRYYLKSSGNISENEK